MKYIKICPKCGSINIAYQTGTFGQLGERTFFDRCNECQFQGIIPEIKEENVQEFRKTLKNSSKDN
jgi:hypothetical protein